MSGERSVALLGTRIDALTMDQVLERARSLIGGGTPSQIITVNVDSLVGNRLRPDLLGICSRAALVVPDGMPLLWAAAWLGSPLPERINGTDLMESLCAEAAARGLAVFLFGGHAGAAEAAGRALAERFPGLRLAGTFCPLPGFEKRPRESEAILSMLRAGRPDILFVSLGYPKGISWIDANLAACRVPLAIEVGMSFRYISGQKRRAPRWMQRRGLEWLWRLVHEPRRLWKRYLISDPPFFYHLARQKLFLRRARRGGGRRRPGAGSG